MKKITSRVFAIVLAALVGLALPALADNVNRQCYRPVELEAEQLLRLHSELMYITYACKQGSRAQDLLTYYDGFTQKNHDTLLKAEQTLVDFYKTRYQDDGIPHLDELRTKLGNEFGQVAADDSAPLFCRQYRDKVISAYYETPAQLQNDVRHMALTHKSDCPLCKVKMAANTKTAPMDKKTP
jgi:hypothetical protein